MRRPPLLTFLTYNRLGNTAVSLPSLLRTEDDFELFIMDNDSKDDTWAFLQDTRDPRIKHRKKFDQNMGVAHPLNYALSHRAEDQDFINFEYDFRIHNKNFITNFNDVYKEFPEKGALSATIFPSQLQLIDNKIILSPERFEERNGKRVYQDTIMGFCSYFPYETMNILRYYDEVNCLLDMDIQARLEVLGMKPDEKKTGYAMDIRVSHILDGGCCSTCLAYHNHCEQGENKCMKYYSRLISEVTNAIGFKELHRITNERIEGRMDFECNSIFNLNKEMSKEEEEGSKNILKLFKELTENYIQEIDSMETKND